MAKQGRSNGLKSAAIHAAHPDQARSMEALGAEAASMPFGVEDVSATSADPETCARIYLGQAIASEATPDIVMPDLGGLSAGFKLLGTETIELTGTKTVKFRQTLNKIPVHRSLVTVELDSQNQLVGINSALGQPEGIDPIARLSPADALGIVGKEGGDTSRAEVARLLFYFDDRQSRWRLCYLFENIPLRGDTESRAEALEPILPIFNYVVDAHDGDLVARVSRIAGAETTEIQATDELQRPRTIRVSAEPPAPGHRLYDPVANVRTYDHDYRDWELQLASLQSRYCEDPPLTSAAVSAHANATVVAEFLRSALRRRGVDNSDGPLVSSINCVYWRQPAGEREWLNAAWIGNQMVYGQRRSGAGLMSTAADLDIVAHEITHGVIENSADLEYRDESGALNESYADIFGIIIANFDEPRSAWDYRIGKHFRSDGRPLRDISDPSARNFPAHMDQYVETDADNGGVHTNSAIHNKAAHNLMAVADADGEVFSAQDLAAIFYLAVTQHLSRTSRFSDSRRAVENAALSLFRALPQEQIERRLNAIREAFDAVGIT
jgi:Zn-dependent metalloprotease